MKENPFAEANQKLQADNQRLLEENEKLKAALRNMVNLSYSTANPKREDIDHGIEIAEKLL